MFSIAVSAGHSDFGRDEILPNPGKINYRDVINFPGPDVLRLGKRPMNQDAYKDLWGTLEDLTASFINSGPYEVQLSPYPGQHLTLSGDGKLRLFWEGREYWTKEGDASCLYPGDKMFRKYKALTLGRYALTLVELMSQSPPSRPHFRRHSSYLFIAFHPRHRINENRGSPVCTSQCVDKKPWRWGGPG
jgi:hypothetical protein